MIGKILRSAKKNFICKVVETGDEIEAITAGVVLRTQTPVVGDFVELNLENGVYLITEIHQRQNEIARHISRERKKKIIAANIDLLVIVVSLGKPAYKRGLVDRYLARALSWNLSTILIFNKADQYQHLASLDINFEAERLAPLEVMSFEVSAKQSTYQQQFLSRGVEELHKTLKGKTALMVGQSGVGKSKLISALT